MQPSFEEKTPITSLFKLKQEQKEALTKLNLTTVRDLLYHLPSRYIDFGSSQAILSSRSGDRVIFFGKLTNLKTSKAFRKKIPMAEGTLTDHTGSIKIVWFNQPYLAKMIPAESSVRVSGTVTERNGSKYLANPDIERVAELPLQNGLLGESVMTESMIPVYEESKGISSLWFQHSIKKLLQASFLDTLEDPIPNEILAHYKLPPLKDALIFIHNPKNESHASAARKRFAFEEVFFIQLQRQQAKFEFEKNSSFVIEPSEKEVRTFIERFPFEATLAQNNAVKDILEDFKSGKPMSRLLEGDVGSGKTAVAATASYAVISTSPKDNRAARLQVAYMAPTEILASQHFESFIKYFTHMNIAVGLITGSGCRKFPSKVNPSSWTDISRTQFLKWVANGEIPIVIGTHALIQKSVSFKRLGLVIIDEQHRFGTNQRMKLARKDDFAPHLLSMTATPIPRTLALTVYGDLDLTLIDEMPAGRKQVITEIVTKGKRDKVYEKIKEEITSGRQAYIICPRIDEPDPDKAMALNAKSVIAEAKRLKKSVFPDSVIGIIHSKMKREARDKVMDDFLAGKIHILVATSVIEVGVNIPNATSIIIEGAERFGLAQLHQLRGRVQRSNHQSYCYLFPESDGEKSKARLKAITEAKNGFELAELDLKLRGPGELSGGKQWGLSDIGMEALKNLKMVEAAREEAKKIILENKISKYPALKEKLAEKTATIHFE
ncbi:MAG: ATP-dependent DNA helicase RecG [Candidatus Paceibacterota bacterium]|jgi:ATP-dependent DNA helicase RecG